MGESWIDMRPLTFPLHPFHCLPDGSENIESELLALDRQCNFEELVKNMKGDTPKIRKWYVGVERRLSESNTELGRMMDRYNDEDLGRMMDRYSDEELGRMMARSGLLLLEFLRFLAELPRSNEFFRPRDRQLSVQGAVIKIDNRIPIFVLKKILEWERDADEDENWQADTDLHSILKQAWPKLSPIQYDICHSHVIAGVPLKDDSHLLEFVYENIIGGKTSDDSHVIAEVQLKDDSHVIAEVHLKDDSLGSSDFNWRKNKRRVNDINLPLAVSLKGKGVKFARNEGFLKKIRFDRRNCTLYLPAIEMYSGTAAVLRNLVLFEASKQEKRSQPLMSYVDLMERLIDKPEDVQALRDVGIIHSQLGTNKDVANVWNRMGKLIKYEPIKYEPIDNAIDDVISFCTSKHRILLDSIAMDSMRRIAWITCISLALAAFQTYLAWEQVRLQRESMPKT